MSHKGPNVYRNRNRKLAARNVKLQAENERLSASNKIFTIMVGALQAERTKLRQALEKIRDAETTCCPRCEGNGRLWADGKAHYPSDSRPTVPCGNCGGSGRLHPENAQDIAAEALAEQDGKEKVGE